MKKDIYIIKNKNNDKVYIGQTVNTTQRWAQYKSAAIKTPNSQLITKAMSKYGFNTFWMEILEKDVENYDEREKYWINYFNSISPNGYNLADGGQGSGNGINSPSAAIKDQKILNEIIDELIMDIDSIETIAKKFNVSRLVVSEINFGHTYYNPDLSYPLRSSNRYSEDKIKQITYALQYELDKSLVDIALEYNCDKSYLNDINQGKSHFREYLTYPLRKGKMKRAEEIFPLILQDLINTQLKQVEIAKKYQVSSQCVSDINQGKKYKQKGVNYPIREKQFDGKTCLTPNELKDIYHDLKNTSISINQLAEKYGISAAAIRNINRGLTKKYHNPNIQYPIRPLK